MRVPSNSLKVYVINLDRSPGRWSAISGQLQRLCPTIEVERWPGVDGKTNHVVDYYHHVDQDKARWIKGRSLSDGQIGCFASHYELWRHIGKSKAPAVVLEDDAVLDDQRFQDFLSISDRLPGAVECLRLSPNETKRARLLTHEAIGPVIWGKYTKGHIGLFGYWLTPSGAQKLSKYFSTWSLPVDLAIGQFWLHGLECYGLEKPCVYHGSFSTTRIWPDRENLGFSAKAIKETNALLSGLKRHIHNFRYKRKNA